MILRKTLLAVMALGASSLFAQRADLLLDGGWMFRFSHQVEKSSSSPVSLPHTWNAQDALSGKTDYKRGIGNYQRKLYVRPEWKGKRLFLRFEGANSVADVFINGKHVGEHRGGYSAFVFEITDRVRYGADNQLWVRVNNGEQLDVMPLVGDFNFYGGLYRDVHLVVTEPACISLTDYASPGVYLRQTRVTPEQADVDAVVKLSNRGDAQEVQVKLSVKDGDREVVRAEQTVTLAARQDSEVRLPVSILKPRLWNGTADPFSYRAEVTLWADGRETDRVAQPLGLRFYRIDPAEGFFLNGKHLPLHGVCRHQDRPEIGNALRLRHHEEDIRLMREMGVNAARLAHYQQAEDMYRLTDREGIVVWAEIPFVGPGGYADKGFVDLPAFRANGQQQLRELIRQNFNHPSICVWGLFNELKEEGDNPIPYIKELNELAHQEDTTRPTTAASNQGGDMNFITDLIAWNRYDGWYGSRPSTLATFLDKTHTAHPELCIAISEYGAGASVYHQQDSLKQPVPTDYWHPENWQTYYHIENWKILSERPFVWGTFVWNMFDFGAAHRHEGDRPGINDKGLVTFDRKQKKDAFYFYKANWNPEPMVHIAGKRLRQASRYVQTIQVFTNCPKVELWVNGKSCGTVVPDKYAMAEWKEVRLAPGENRIVVCSVGNKKHVVQDETVIAVKVSESEFL
ncbi:MAG: glycoside hydrolase family 2 protein [Phocaeicola plebeius]|nr:glycoside hydrolase family 2 protein [Phocaeicola plebeius]